MSYIIVGLPQIWAIEFLELRKFKNLPIVIVKKLPDGSKDHVMQALPFENASESMIINIFIDNLRGIRISESLERLLHVVPLQFDTRSVHKTKFFMYISSYVANPVVIESILRQFGLTFWQMDIGRMGITI
jgi:hypothetical protein